MVDGDSRSHLCVLLVGAVRDDLVRGLERLAGEYEAALVRCSDVYAAVAECARSQGRCTLVVGRLRELAREQGRFFSLAARKGMTCCGVLDPEVPLERDEVLVAVRMGVSIAAGVDQVEGVFENWLGVGGFASGRSALTAEEYRASEAELNALLGQDVDG